MTTPDMQSPLYPVFEKMYHSQERYREARDHLIATHAQFRRNQQTLKLAQQEADNLNREWKQLLRDNNGKTTSAVTKKLQESCNARDIAQELEPILSATPEILEAAEIEAITARKAYLEDRKEYIAAMLAEDLESSIDSIADIPEFQAFAIQISQYLTHYEALQREDVRLQIMQEPDVKDGAMSSDDLRELEQKTKARVCARLYEIMRQAGLQENMEILTGDEEIPESQEEKASPLRYSPLRQKQARERLAASA